MHSIDHVAEAYSTFILLRNVQYTHVQYLLTYLLTEYSTVILLSILMYSSYIHPVEKCFGPPFKQKTSNTYA